MPATITSAANHNRNPVRHAIEALRRLVRRERIQNIEATQQTVHIRDGLWVTMKDPGIEEAQPTRRSRDIADQAQGAPNTCPRGSHTKDMMSPSIEEPMMHATIGDASIEHTDPIVDMFPK